MTQTAHRDVRVDVHVGPHDYERALSADVRAGLTAAPKELPPKYFYDDRGSELFDAITRLPEYYPTRAERAILELVAPEIAARTAADTLIELGSGTSEKTRLLLGALDARGTLERFVPFDVSEATLRSAASAVADEYSIVGACSGRRLRAPPRHAPPRRHPGRRVPREHDRQPHARDARHVPRRDRVGLGARRRVPPRHRPREGRRPAAPPRTTTPAGVTAEFNRNVLHVVNRALDADFDPDRFAHVARWDPDEQWIEMWLRTDAAHSVRVGGPRPRGRVRGRRGDAHRDQRQVHPRSGWRPSSPPPASPSTPGGPTLPASSPSR